MVMNPSLSLVHLLHGHYDRRNSWGGGGGDGVSYDFNHRIENRGLILQLGS